MISQEIIYKEYIKNKKSPYQIASEYNTYPNNIRRAVRKYGYELRNHSTAQSLAIKEGRHPHPTKGKPRSNQVKLQISESLAANWQALTDEERQHRIDTGKKHWQSLTDEEKTHIRQLAAKAIKASSIYGSKLEKFLYTVIRNLGYDVEFHKKDLLVNEKLHLDLFVPKLKLAIEVDGPSHFLPIWGEDSLRRHIKADLQKNGLLLSRGFRLLRIKHMKTKLSQKVKRDVQQSIQTLFTELSKTKHVSKLYELEV